MTLADSSGVEESVEETASVVGYSVRCSFDLSKLSLFLRHLKKQKQTDTNTVVRHIISLLMCY